MKLFNTDVAPRTIIFFVMLILILVFLGNIAEIALMFFAAFVLACTLNPIVEKMERRMPRVLAATIVLLVLLLLTLGILIPLISISAEQFLLAVKQIPKILAEMESKEKITFLGYSIKDIIDPIVIKSYISNFSGDILEHSINATKLLANSLATILAVAIMLFYILIDASSLRASYLALFPPKFKKRAADILDIIQVKVGGFVWGQLISMIFVGVVVAIGLALIGHSHALLLGFLTGILDIIPVIGPTIATAIGLCTSFSGGFWYVLLVFAIFIVTQWLENQFLRPIVFGRLMDMHPLMIILSLLVGAKFLGIWGVILAPAIASVICVLVDELYIQTVNKTQCDETKCTLPDQAPSPEEN